MDFTAAVAVNVNVFFYFEVKMFFEVKEQVRVIARAGASARTEIGHFPQIRIFFFAFLGLEIEMGHSFDNFLSRHFPYEHSEIFSTNFYYALPVFLEQWLHKKKLEIREGR